MFGKALWRVAALNLNFLEYGYLPENIARIVTWQEQGAEVVSLQALEVCLKNKTNKQKLSIDLRWMKSLENCIQSK